MTARRRRILAWVAAAFTAMGGILILLPLDPTIVTARAVALAAIVHLIWRYHRLADWEDYPIGRSTMAIKGAILIIAVAANARSINISNHLDLATTGLDVARHHGPLYAIAELGIVLGWLAMASALILRARLVVEKPQSGSVHALSLSTRGRRAADGRRSATARPAGS